MEFNSPPKPNPLSDSQSIEVPRKDRSESLDHQSKVPKVPNKFAQKFKGRGSILMNPFIAQRLTKKLTRRQRGKVQR